MNIYRSPSKKNRFTHVASNKIPNKSWVGKMKIVDSLSITDGAKRSSNVMIELSEEDVLAAFTGLVKGYKDDSMRKTTKISILEKKCSEQETELFLWKTGRKTLES